MGDEGRGPAEISSQAGYLISELEAGADVWRLAVPVQAANEVRGALKKLGVAKKSNVRLRGVPDVQATNAIKHLDHKQSDIPLSDIVRLPHSSSGSRRVKE